MRSEPIGDLLLDSSQTLQRVEVSYEARGMLAPNRDNVVLVLHGYTSGPDTILPVGEQSEGSWRDLIGPGSAIDTNRYYVICPNALGSTYGTTGAASINPATGQPYGSSLPDISMSDVVLSQSLLLDKLGIGQLHAVVGPSFGGCQALQWAVDQPQRMKGVVAALASFGRPPVNLDQVRAGLARDPRWNGGDYYDGQGNLDIMVPLRVQTLKSYGVDDILARSIRDPAEREAVLIERAKDWAKQFDANALLTIMKIMASYDIESSIDRIRAKLLYVLSRTDHLFPPTLAEQIMPRLAEEGVDCTYFEIDSDNGHAASATDAALWAPVLRDFLDGL